MLLLTKLPAHWMSVQCSSSNTCLQRFMHRLASLLRSSSSFVTMATSSSSLSLGLSIRTAQTCTCVTSKEHRNATYPKQNTKAQGEMLNCQIRYLNSGTTTSLNSMVFSEENKARVIKQMSTMKPSTTRALFKQTPARHAGICVPLCRVDGVPSILFTLRSRLMATHKGEISFPGGIKEETDEDITQTALREMSEELGIDSTSVDIWGQLVPIPDGSLNTSVTATVVYIGDVDVTKLQYNTDEVELAFTLPISHLCDRQNNGYTRFDPPRASAAFRGSYIMPVFLGGGFHIWGLTAIFTDLTLTVLTPDHYKSIYEYLRT